MPPPAPRSTGRWVVVALILGVLVTVGAAVFALAIRDRADSRAGFATSPPAAPSTSAPATATRSSMADAVREWEAKAGDHFKQSAQALEEISQAADVGDTAVVRAACQRLHDTNAVGLQADLPTPDPELTAELQRMVDDMNTATHACLRFADSMQPEDATTYQDYLTRAVEHLGRAKAILNADLGKG